MGFWRRFTRSGVAALIAVAVPVVAAAQTAPAGKCNLLQIVSMKVRFEANRPLVEASINGHPVLLLADTGASSSLLYAGAVRKAGLSPVYVEGVEFSGVGGTRHAMEVTVADFRLGESAIKNLKFFVIDGEDGKDVAGILGQDFFGQAEAEFDLANGAVRLFSAKGCELQNLAYWSKTPAVADLHHGGSGSFQIDALLNGRPTAALLDSGAQISAVTSIAANTAGVQPAPTDPIGQGRGIGPGTVKSSLATFDSLAVGDESIAHVRLAVGDYFHVRDSTSIYRDNQSSGIGMLIGADFFRSHRLMFSQSQRRIYFTYSGGPVFQVVSPSVEGPAPAPGK